MIHGRWISTELDSTEHVKLLRTETGWSLVGRAELPFDGLPAVIDYVVHVDDRWHTTTADVAVCRDGEEQLIALANNDGGWSLNGDRRADLDGCIDVDLGWTPATNTLPIRRLDLRPGQSAATTAVWLRLSELDVRPLAQRYKRLTPDRYLYESSNFSAELAVNEHGLVTRYGDELWVMTE